VFGRGGVSVRANQAASYGHAGATIEEGMSVLAVATINQANHPISPHTDDEQNPYVIGSLTLVVRFGDAWDGLNLMTKP